MRGSKFIKFYFQFWADAGVVVVKIFKMAAVDVANQLPVPVW